MDTLLQTGLFCNIFFIGSSFPVNLNRIPEVPLHNNASENGARVEKRLQDISLQTKTWEGTRAKDTMMSIVQTCKKLGISSYKFIYDRVNEINKYPTLAQMIRAKAAGQPIVI